MAINLSLTDIQQEIVGLQRNAESQLELDPGEVCLKLPPTLGTGYLRGAKLREGLEFCVQDFIPKYDVRLNSQNLSIPGAYVSLTFCIVGQFNGSLADVYSHLTMRANNAVFCANPHALGAVEYKAGEHVRFVGITLSPDLMLSLIDPDLAELPRNLQQALQSGLSQPAMHFCDTSFEMAQTLNKIIYSPYHGKIRSVYLEGNVLELIALYFSQFCHPANSSRSTVLKRQDMVRLYECREILKQNLTSPPALSALANRVGLSEYKLQQGFRELFGTTVFGVLHHDRMEYARQLLETQQMTVEAIANKVGISHRGYFAKAFKRKFGSTPREHLKRFN